MPVWIIYPPICMALGQWLPDVFQALLVVAVAFVALALATSFMRFQILTAHAGADEDRADADDALHLCVIRKLSLIRRDVDTFSVFVIGTAGHLSAPPVSPDAERYRAWLEACLRGVSRKTDSLFRYRDTLAALVADTGRGYARLVAERLYAALASEANAVANGALSPVLGVATFPENGSRAHALIDRAFEAMQSVPEGGICILDEEACPAAPEDMEDEEPAASRLLDPLTGVLREERVSLNFQKYVARYRKDEVPVSILYLDIDALRRYNEHYGRPAGDALLKGVGEVLRKQLRETDLIGRYGGDEFLVAMPCAVADAERAATRLIAEIRNYDVVLDHNHLKATACIGIAGFPDHGVSAGQLFEAADSALQAAKAKGRAVCEVYEESMRSAVHDKRIADVF
ncbi:MAG: diguanylate cyclase [Spartobacteria bacterium]|nr:diguanylate cyclase [Spartobacteria bacterium]